MAGGLGSCDGGVELVVAAAARHRARRPRRRGPLERHHPSGGRQLRPAAGACRRAGRRRPARWPFGGFASTWPPPPCRHPPTPNVPTRGSTAWIVRMRADQPAGIGARRHVRRRQSGHPWPCPTSWRPRSSSGPRPVHRRSPRCSPRSPPNRSSSPRSTRAAAPPASPVPACSTTRSSPRPGSSSTWSRPTVDTPVAADQAALDHSAGPARVHADERAGGHLLQRGPARSCWPACRSIPRSRSTTRTRCRSAANPGPISKRRACSAPPSAADGKRVGPVRQARLPCRRRSTSAGFPAGRGAPTAPVTVRPLAEPQQNQRHPGVLESPHHFIPGPDAGRRHLVDEPCDGWQRLAVAPAGAAQRLHRRAHPVHRRQRAVGLPACASGLPRREG